MRILQVTDRLSTRGGADLYLRGLIEGLATATADLAGGIAAPSTFERDRRGQRASAGG